jgi:hypothetical protein
MMKTLSLFLLLLLTAIRLSASDPATKYAVLAITDATGSATYSVLTVSGSGTNAPEFRAAQHQADLDLKAAKDAWQQRRTAWEAVPENRGKNYRKVEAEPKPVTLRLIGAPEKDQAAAEEIVANLRRDDLLKNNPGLARRSKAIHDRLLQYFTIGMDATPEWLNETRDQFGCRFAAMSGYLSHIITTQGDLDGKDTWFFKYGALQQKFADCRTANVICWNTWYGMADAPPADYKPGPAQATPANAKVKATMITYWSLLKKFMQTAKDNEDVDCVLQVEPDEWGHLLLSCGMDPNAPGVVLVGGSGMPELSGVPDTVAGWAKGFRILRDTYAPQVILCANPSAWDIGGSMSGQKWCDYFKAMDVTPEGGWDLFVTQLHDWDMGLNSNGANAKWPPYAEKDVVTYYGSVDNWCAWIKTIHDGTGMWGVAWQLPVGNCTYATCDGSDGHGMDAVAELLLDGYPDNTVAQRMADAGCCMWIFSHGGGGASVTDAKKDGVTNPAPHAGDKGLKSIYPDDDGGYMRLNGQIYWKNPVAILAPPVVAKGKHKNSTAERTVDDRTASATSGDSTAAAAAAAPDGTAAAAAGDHPRIDPTAIDPGVRDSWVAALQAELRARLNAHHQPQFTFAAMPGPALVEAVDQTQVMTLHIEGMGEMTAPWASMKAPDLASLAEAMADQHDADSQADAAWFLLMAGDGRKASDHLIYAGKKRAEIEQTFGLGK